MLAYQNQVNPTQVFSLTRIGQPTLYQFPYRAGLAIKSGSFAKAYNVGVSLAISRLGKMEN